MNTEKKKTGRGVWFMPLVLALPFLAVITFAAVKFGPTLLRMINVMIKAAVMA